MMNAPGATDSTVQRENFAPYGAPAAMHVESDADAISVELSSRRTGMSFQRTRMSADRTLMAVIRTSLSLITFGFTIYQFFERLADSNLIQNPGAGRNFGLALVILGVGMVLLGIIYHLQFMYRLRLQRVEMISEGLIHGQSRFPVSLTLIIAILLLGLGLMAFVGMVFNVGLLD
jgi:putative membrane protein